MVGLTLCGEGGSGVATVYPASQRSIPSHSLPPSCAATLRRLVREFLASLYYSMMEKMCSHCKISVFTAFIE